MAKYLICGGGISGLYSALLLLDNRLAKGSEIRIVEKSWRIGGRIQTIENDGLTIEAGAGRFSNSHQLLINLIKRYRLEDKIMRLNNNKNLRLILDKSIVLPSIQQIQGLIHKLIGIKLDESMRYKTFEQLCNEIFGLELTHLYRTYFGYDEEFYKRNAYDGLVSMKTEFGQEIYYNILIGGLSQIVESTKKELEEAGVSITLNLKLVDWSENNAEFVDFSGNKTSIEYSKLILAMDKHYLTGLPKLVLRYSNVLNSVEPCQLMRVYAKFPINPDTKIVWFHGLSKTSTNSSIRSFIPINEVTGLCMISYSDGNIAKEWQDLAILGDLEHYVMKYIREMYPEKEIPEPEWIKHYFWHNGCYFYIPYVVSSQIIQQIVQPFDNIFICGECYSGIQGWIEGALDSSIQVIDLIKNNSKKDEKEYTMAEVAASDSLTVIDGNVYNLLKNNWIDRHPGGEIIKKAIGKDATAMFTYINHPKYAKDILEELFVGILKESD